MLSSRLSRFSAKLSGFFLLAGAFIFFLRNFQNEFSTSTNRETRRCQPQTNILFLKTHKTGSSTVTNILNRYCDRNGLTMALPREGMFNFFWPLPFDESFVDPEDQPVNILCNHGKFSQRMSLWMPDSTTFITIIRHPISQFESLFSYMEFGSLFGLQNRKNAIEAFLEDPLRHVANLTSRHDEPNVAIKYPHINLLKNGQFFDLGLDGEDVPDYEDKIEKAITQLEKTFHLVLVMEYFDESLVLLANELCWKIEDVLYFKQNQRRLKDKTPKLSQKAIKNLNKWNKADFMLYQHFNKSFWRKVRQQDRRHFWRQVNLLKNSNKALERDCLEPGEHDGKVYENQSKSVKGLKLKGSLNSELQQKCQRMITSEINYMKYFRQKRKSRKMART